MYNADNTQVNIIQRQHRDKCEYRESRGKFTQD